MGDRSKDDSERKSDTPERSPYVTPDIAWEDQLGTRPGLVAACGKVVTQGPACDAQPGS